MAKLISEDFFGNPDATIRGRSASGETWTCLDATGEVCDGIRINAQNQAKSTLAASCVALIDSAEADHYAQAKIYAAGPDKQVAIVVRAADFQTFIGLRAVSATQLELFTQAGSSTQARIALITVPEVASGSMLKLVAAGRTLKVYLDGAIVGSPLGYTVEDERFDGVTRLGLWTRGIMDPAADDFEAGPLVSASDMTGEAAALPSKPLSKLSLKVTTVWVPSDLPRGQHIASLETGNAGSTLSIVDDAGGMVTLVGDNLVTATQLTSRAAALGPQPVVVAETLSDGSATATTRFEVGVFAQTAPNLKRLDLDVKNLVVMENAPAGQVLATVLGQTPGSVLSLAPETPLGVALNSASQLVTTGSPFDHGLASEQPVTVIESLGTARNSPRWTTFTLAIGNVSEGSLLEPLVLTPSAPVVPEDAPAGTLVASIAGRSTGSTLSVLDTAGGRFVLNASGQLVTGSVGLDYETATSHHVTLRETLASASNSPKDTILSIGVANAAEGGPLKMLGLEPAIPTILEDAPAGTLVASITGRTSGSTLSIVDDAGGRFALDTAGQLVTGAVALDYETGTSHQITVRETLADTPNSPKDSILTVAVGNVREGGPLRTLSLSPDEPVVPEDAPAGSFIASINGKSAGSTLNLIDSADGRFVINAAGQIVTGAVPLDYEAAALHQLTIRETLADAENSPKDTIVTISVANVLEGGPLLPLGFEPAEPTVLEDAPAGTVVASILGLTEGSKISMVDSDGGRFALNAAGQIVTGQAPLDYETAVIHKVTVREVLGDTPNSPRESTLTIAIGNVLEGGPLVPLGIDPPSPSVLEDVQTGTVVGSITGRTTGSTLSMTDSAGGRFALNASGQLVTGAVPLDYETATSHKVIIRETLADTPNSPKDTELTIAVDNALEGGPLVVLALNPVSPNVLENTPAGTLVGAIIGRTGGSTLALIDSATGRFAINAAGQLVTGSVALDYETATSHKVTVRETLPDTPNSPKDSVLTVSVGNVSEGGPLLPLALNPAAPSVLESTPAGTVVASITGRTAGSTLTLTDNAGGRFILNAAGQLVTGSVLLDYETSTSHKVTLRETLADTENSPKDTVVTVAVGNVSEGGPLVALGLTPTAPSVLENTAAGTLVASITGRTAGSTLTLVDSASGRFALNAAGQLVTGAVGLDYETATSHKVTIRETLADTANSPKDTVLTITVGNVSEGGPLLALGLTPASPNVLENTAAGVVVGSITGRTAGSTLSLYDSAGNRFALNAAGQLVTGTVKLDYETATSHKVTVRETLADTANSPKDSVLTITVGNVSEGGPLLALGLSPASPNVLENTPAGTVVGSITGRTAGSTLALADGAGGRFALNASGQLVTGSVLLDYESAASHQITLRETLADTGNSPKDTVLTINVGNVLEGGPLVALGLSPASPSVAETAKAGTEVATITGKTAGSTVTMTDSAGGRFAIDAATGRLVTGATALSYSTAASHQVTIRETLADAANSPKDTVLTIAVARVTNAVTVQKPIPEVSKILFQDDFRSGVSLRTGGDSHSMLSSGTGIYAQRYFYGQWGNDPAPFGYSYGDEAYILNALNPQVAATGWSPFETGPNGLLIKMHRRSTLPANLQELLDAKGIKQQWVSGILTTQHSINLKPPFYAEIRSKFVNGPGVWAAFWTLGTDRCAKIGWDSSPQLETDIQESIDTRQLINALHWHTEANRGSMYAVSNVYDPGFDMGEDYHTYGCYFTDDSRTFYVDGLKRGSLKFEPKGDPLSPPRLDQWQYLLLTHGMGNFSTGSTTSTPDKCGYYIDYLRVWGTDATPMTMNGFKYDPPAFNYNEYTLRVELLPSIIGAAPTAGKGNVSWYWNQGGVSGSGATAVDGLTPLVIAIGTAGQYGRREAWVSSSPIKPSTKYKAVISFNYTGGSNPSNSLKMFVYAGSSSVNITASGTTLASPSLGGNGKVENLELKAVGKHMELTFDWTPNVSTAQNLGAGFGPNSTSLGKDIVLYDFDLSAYSA